MSSQSDDYEMARRLWILAGAVIAIILVANESNRERIDQLKSDLEMRIYELDGDVIYAHQRIDRIEGMDRPVLKPTSRGSDR